MTNRKSDDSLFWPGVGAFVLGFLLSLGLARACQAQSPTPADGTWTTPRQIAVPVAAAWATSVYAIRADREFHHAYIGAAMLANRRRWMQWLGLAILADDALQHVIQTRRPDYRSPAHLLYRVTLYRWVIE